MGETRGGGLPRNSQQNWELCQISKKYEKRGAKWLFYPIFVQILAEYVLFVTIINIYFDMGGHLDGGRLRIP